MSRSRHDHFPRLSRFETETRHWHSETETLKNVSQDRDTSRDIQLCLGCGPLKNEIDISSLIIWSTSRVPPDSQQKVHNCFIILHLFKEIHSRNIIAESCKSVECLSAAWTSGSEGRFYDGHVHKVGGSTPTQASLLRPLTRCFTTIISAWCNLASSKLNKSEAKLNRNTWKQGQLLGESRYVLRIAPLPLFRDRRIHMKKKSHQRK